MKSEEVRGMLSILERDILLRVEEFEKTTDLRISGIEVSHHLTVSAIPEYNDKLRVGVTVQARL